MGDINPGSRPADEPAFPEFSESNKDLDYDVLIIGAGLSGIYSLHKMKQLGLRVRVLEAASDVGGTWFWNRYPGARFDSESYSYGFSFSQEILDKWNWTEHFASQPEILAYCEFVVQTLELRPYMQFNTRVNSMYFQDADRSWLLTDEDGKIYSTRFVITCMGILSTPTLPNVPGVADFKGRACHTARWPREPVDFRDKRVAIIGTGATGIQVIQEIVKTVGHLTVFQRTPNWSAPLRNKAMSLAEMEEIRAQYPEIFKKCKESFACFIHGASTDTRKTMDVPKEERETFWESIYVQPGFKKWLSNYRDQGYDREANATYSDFMANKIRGRVKDPVTAEKLIPKNHGFGTRRVPLETHYFEAYNRDNVRLIDINEDPIERITEKGIKTMTEDMEFDIIIYATGFDAVTGAFTVVDIRGVNGIRLNDHWRDGPKTFLGFFTQNFPSLLMVMGPHQAFGNIPRSIEYAVGWHADFIAYAAKNNITYAEATREGVEAWTTHVHDCAKGLLANEVDSWMTGVNKNLAYKQKRFVARYGGPAPGFRKRCDEVAARSYSELKLLRHNESLNNAMSTSKPLPKRMYAWRKYKGNPNPMWEEIDVPSVPENGYLVKLLASGVCHSDDSLLKLEKQRAHFHERYTLGHEGCGEIIQVGKKVVQPLCVGDKVALLAVPGCGGSECPECSRDLAQLCQIGTHHGIGQDGFFAPYVAVNLRAVVKTPPGIPPPVVAVATDAVLTAYHGVVRRAEVNGEETVFLFGLGGLGFNALQIIHKAIGAKVIVSDVRAERLNEAAKLGVPLTQIVPAGTSVQQWVIDNGYDGKIDTVLDFVGKNQTFQDAQQILRPGGKMLLVGTLDHENTVDMKTCIRKRLTLIFTYGGQRKDLIECLDLIANGVISPQVETAHLKEFPKVLSDLCEGKINARVALLHEE